MTATTIILLSAAFLAFAVSSPLEFKPALDTGIKPIILDGKNYRLGDEVIPSKYDIKITPTFDENGSNDFTFVGNVKITLTVKAAQLNAIVLHHKNMNITSYRVERTTTLLAQNTIPATDTYDSVTEKWTIPLTSNLMKGQEATITVDYKGYMLDDMAGFYRSSYKEGDKTVWLGTTQFEQTDARRAFPCFDEPGFKAKFQLTIDHPNDYNAVSNTPAVGATVPSQTPGRSVTTFKETPEMSTYLVAFIVSKFTRDANTNGNFGVVARPAAVTTKATKLALEFGEEMLRTFGEKFGIRYSDMMEKMDTAAIPDFSAGAMENWGLLTYRESSSLFHEGDSTTVNKQRIVAVIAHEQAHQWFGDLVTCKWWSETWLNEGFARYYQYFGTQMIEEYKNWNLEEQFVVENHHQSMTSIDATDRTHPMTDKTVQTQKQASGIFDNISYNKAASIIRMISYILRGDDTNDDKFYNVLRRYLSDNQYNAVEPDKLLTTFDQLYPESNIAKILGDWSQTPGFPLVTASLDGQILKLTQKRFMQDTGIENNKEELYNIPITYVIDSDKASSKVNWFLKENEKEASFNLTKKPEKHYILNVRQMGYYRVNYDNENWMKIREALHSENHDDIDVLNRAQIVDDLFQLARAGTVEYKFAMDIIRYIKNETDYIPWLTAINNGLTYLSQRVKIEEKQQDLFSGFIRDIMNEIYDHLGFVEPKPDEDKTAVNIYNRANILNWACKYGHEECIKKSKELFALYKADKTKKVHPDIRAVVYCNAIRYGESSDYDYLDARYAETDVMQEQLNILSGLACTKNETFANKYLDRLLKSNDIRIQDWAGAQSYLLNANPESVDFFYNYVTSNHEAWSKRFDGLGYLSTIAGRFTDNGQFDKYEKFLTDERKTLGDDQADSLIKSMNSLKAANLKWDDEKMKAFMDYLQEINGAVVTSFSVILSTITVTILYILN